MEREWFEGAQSQSAGRFSGLLHAFSSLFSYFAVPIAVAVLSLLIAVLPAGQVDPGLSIPLPMRVMTDPARHLDITSAAAALKAAPSRMRYDTHLSETPIWFAVTPSAGTAVLFPSRHMQSLSCFDGATLQPIADLSQRQSVSRDLTRSGSGVALLHRSSETICRATFIGLAYLSATQMSPEHLKLSNDLFYRRSALLEGGLVTLAVFIFITAIINRDWVYVVFAVWLFGNLRLSLISMGADEQWFGYAIPIHWISLIRTVTVPVYYILTCTLFRALFKSSFARVGYQGWFTAILALGPVLLLASVALPVPIFLPVMWAIVGFAVMVLAFLLGRMLVVAPSRIVVWYSAAMCVAIVSSFSEVISATFHTPIFAQMFNSMTATLVSSLMAALALAEQMRAERIARQQAIDTLSFLADHDPLTGALNRRGMHKAMTNRGGGRDGSRDRNQGPDRKIMTATVGSLGSAGSQASASLIVAYLDLDRFKLINDLFGHNVGDQVLKHVCSRIQSQLRARDLVCRMGGDEFVMLFNDMAIADATRIAQAIVDAIDGEPYLIGRQAFRVRGSIGLIESPAGLGAQEAISVADQACRTAKGNGNGRVVVYAKDAIVFQERATELRLMETFSGELPLSGLFLEMQPILFLKAPYERLDFEVLLRMRGPDGNVVPPFNIITAAEANGTISALDRWVIETTLTWIDAHRDKLSNTSFVSVNVSGASLNDEHFVKQIDELFRRYQHVLPLLCLEITEGVALHDLSNTRRFIGSVQRLGAQVALDDFGAGYTSFTYLRDLPADALKIDGGFVRQIHDVAANAAIVEAIVGLARNLGMQSIAEWAEDAPTLGALQRMGVDYVQGFVIARPQSPETILSMTSAADLITDPEVLRLLGPRPADSFSLPGSHRINVRGGRQ